MKIVNEKGKLFGVINIVDLLVLLAVVALALGVGYKLFKPQIADKLQEQVDMTVVVRVRGATPFLQQEIAANPQIGKQLVSGSTFTDAVITDMVVTDYVQQMPTDEGEINSATDPVKKDLVFTIVSKVPAGTAAPSIGTQEVRAGRTFILKTNDFETTGNIDSVDIGSTRTDNLPEVVHNDGRASDERIIAGGSQEGALDTYTVEPPAQDTVEPLSPDPEA